jgi:hypothetical protein
MDFLRKVLLKDGRWYRVLKPGMKWEEEMVYEKPGDGGRIPEKGDFPNFLPGHQNRVTKNGLAEVIRNDI